MQVHDKTDFQLMETKDEQLLFLSERHPKLTVIDLEHIESVGGWKFLESITPLILKSSRDFMRRIIFAHEANDFDGMKNSLRKLHGTANIIGASKLVRCILKLQVLVENKDKDMTRDLEYLVDCYNEIEELLGSSDIEKAITGGKAS